MKFALDRKRLHLRFFFGMGFALFILRKIIERKNPDSAQNVKSIGKQLKRLLKGYKRANGALNLVEIESEGTRIIVRI